MKNILLPVSVAVLFCGASSFCKNTPVDNAKTAVLENAGSDKTPLPPGKADSLVGLKGCEKAAWSAVSADTDEFIYQHFTVRKTRSADQPGEQVMIMRDSNRGNFALPMPEDGHFMGAVRNMVFVDRGFGSEGRELLIFDVDRMVQYYSSPYCGEPEVVQSEKLYFLIPVAEQDVVRMPDCPQREEWTKAGLGIGYGQRAIMNLTRRSLTKKSEWVCVARQ
jgi:hypothetical protein